MTRFCATLLLIAVGSSASALAAEPTRKDIDAMQGTWAIVSFTADGSQIAAETINSWRRIVDGDRVTWKQGEEILVELTIKFDPTAKPMTLDSTIAAGENKGQTMLAIYELDGDEFRMCFAPPGMPRPTEFSSAAGSGQLLYTANRLKP